MSQVNIGDIINHNEYGFGLVLSCKNERVKSAFIVSDKLIINNTVMTENIEIVDDKLIDTDFVEYLVKLLLEKKYDLDRKIKEKYKYSEKLNISKEITQETEIKEVTQNSLLFDIEDELDNKTNTIYPNNYKDDSNISNELRKVTKLFDKNVTNSKIVLNANIGKNIFNYILNSNGIYLFVVNNSTNMNEIILIKDAINMKLKNMKEAVFEKLKIYSSLYSDDKFILNIETILVYPNIDLRENAQEIYKNKINFTFKSLEYFDNETQKIEKLKLEKLNTNELSLENQKLILKVISPELIVIQPDKPLVNLLKANLKVEDIIGNEREFKTFELFQEQVKWVNDIKEGHSLILSNAGSGKSVILLSKAIKLASLNQNSSFLITCFNTNLAETYKFKRQFAGLNDKNLYVMTFHKFLMEYIRSCFKISHFSYKDVDSMIDFLIQKNNKGQITKKFKGIFIDEVQIFEPKWIDICYMLLEDPKSNCVFLLCGDINQDLRSQTKNGKASWQKAQLIPSPKFRGRVKYLRKNFRNTKEISEFLNKYIRVVDQFLTELNYQKDDDYERVTIGESDRNGVPVKHIITDRYNEKSIIIDEIKNYIKNHNGNYSDISILFPFKQNVYFKYFIFNWICEEFDREGIPYNLIFNDETEKTKVYEPNGVVLSTIDSSLGLDFKCVILCGLLPLNFFFDDRANKKHRVFRFSDVLISKDNKNNQMYLENYKNASYKIYTACSRARDKLIILNTLEKENRMYKDLNKSLEVKK